MANEEIRKEAKAAGVPLWKLAEKFGVNDGNFSRKLRKEFSDDTKERIRGYISELKEVS